ncbi:hypothetical protein ABZW49_10230 [Nonomuraea wenchangensis]
MSEQQTEADLARTHVDVHDWGPTEADEEDVLKSLYGPPGVDGVYRGEGESA